MILLKHNPMKSDVREKKDAYLLEVDLPGCCKEDIKAYIEKGYLYILASLNKGKTEEHGKFLRRECFSGEYQRSFYFGEDIDTTGMRAVYKHGVLKVLIPKLIDKKGKESNLISID